jgi:hypothetical protein
VWCGSREVLQVTGDATDTTVWARVDNGALVSISLVGDCAVEIGEALRAGDPPLWWPPMGLRLVDDVAPSEAATPECRISVDVSSAWSCDRAESDLGLFAAEWVDGLVAVHAAVIRADDSVIVVPGPSFAGKTTLCVAAIDAGYDVLSDEYALVDPDTAMVRGWPRRLRVRQPDGGATRVAVRSVTEPVAVHLVAVVTRPQPTDSQGPALDVVDISGGEVATELLANTVCASSRPQLAFDAAVAVARVTPGVKGQRGQADEALQALVELAAPTVP